MDRNNIKSVVSMLASDKKTTLFTATGEVIDMLVGGPYDTSGIADYLTPRLTGTSAVDINLDDFIRHTSGLNLSDLASAGIVMTQVIEGKTVQGIFYPIVKTVEVTVGPDKVVIPHVDNLHAHMARAAKDGSPSVVNFFKRLAPVIQARKHSGEDLMMFIKKSEMPLTNDGRIIAYKRVKGSTDDYVVDSHTGKIRQRVGSRVTMPVDMVDPSRHRSCSTGLHVANLGYLGGFSGDKTLIVLVDPENFIAVPHGEDTKARVSSYDIIGIMTSNSHATVNKGNHVSGDQSFEKLITDAVEGRSVQPFEEILVGDKAILSVTPLQRTAVVEQLSKNKTTGASLAVDSTPEAQEAAAPEVVKNLRKAKAESLNPETLGLEEQVYRAFKLLFQGKTKTEIAHTLNTSTRSIGRWMERHDYEGFVKKFAQQETPNEANEVSQQDLEAAAEFHDAVVQETKLVDFRVRGVAREYLIPVIKELRTHFGLDLKQAKQVAEGSILEAVSIEKCKRAKMAVEAFGAKAEYDWPYEPEPTPQVHPNDANVGKPMTIAQQARVLFDAGGYTTLLAFKKDKKKSWQALGFTDAEVDQIPGSK